MNLFRPLIPIRLPLIVICMMSTSILVDPCPETMFCISLREFTALS